MIPCDWQIRSLREVAQVQSGIAKNAKRQVRNAVEVHYLRVANVQDGYLDLDQMSTIRLSRDELARYAVLPGDVLMNEGGDLDQLGRGAMWRGEFDPCVHQNHVFVVRCRAGLLPEFLNAWTASTHARRYFLLAGKQTTNLASINKTALSELPVPVPPPAEQRAIAEALADVDGLLTALDTLIAKKRAIKKAVMQQLLTGRTRLPGFSGSWGIKRLGAVLSIHHGKSQRDVEVRDGPYPILASGGRIGYARRPIYDKPSVLIGRKGTIDQPQYMESPFWTVDTLFYSSMVADNSAKFFYYRFCLIDWMRYNEASGVPSLNARTIEGIELPCPEPLEQEAIANVVSEIDMEISSFEMRRDKTRAIKQGMMQQLLTGRVRLIQPSGDGHA